MNNITVLHLGIKYWPYTESIINHTSLKGIRGGGMNKYCDMLISSLPGNINTIIICQRLKDQKKKEKLGNVTIYRTWAVGNRAWRQMIANIISFIIALRIVKEERVDIIHGHMLFGIFNAYHLGKIFSKPVVGTPYSFITIEQIFIFNRIGRYLETKYYQKIDCLIFESEENREKAEKFKGISFKNSKVINTGIPIPKTMSCLTNSSKTNILYIGRLVNVKAIENLVISVLYLHKTIRSQIHVNIVGEGEMYDFLHGLIDTNNLTDTITLQGFVKNSTEVFLNNDVFILPSHQEGLSISLLEAMSFGLACIVNNFGVPFSRNVVFQMENNNPETIAKAITYFIENIDILNAYKSAARKEILKGFTIEKFVNEYTMTYNRLKG
jgi:glycosyltransferase involved in cell wall biosynthesis